VIEKRKFEDLTTLKVKLLKLYKNLMKIFFEISILEINSYFIYNYLI
jgi:hypothetical protein